MSRSARVIVATYEQLPALRLVLRGYLRQTVRDFALTVADDGSGEDTRTQIEAFAREAREQDLDVDHVRIENRGFRKARALNEAVRCSAGEPLLIFTDGDCVPPAHLVERHLDAHAERSFAVGGVVLLSEDASGGLTPADIDAGRHETLATPADLVDLRRRARKSRWGVRFHLGNRPKVFGANVAIDRALFDEINGFDEAFREYGFEDSDLRDRVMRTRPRPRVRVLHGSNDVFHLWHARPEGRREASRPYYSRARPVRCVAGLVQEPGVSADDAP